MTLITANYYSIIMTSIMNILQHIAVVASSSESVHHLRKTVRQGGLRLDSNMVSEGCGIQETYL